MESQACLHVIHIKVMRIFNAFREWSTKSEQPKIKPTEKLLLMNKQTRVKGRTKKKIII